MSDIDHLPVRPNINNTYSRNTKSRIPNDLNKSGLLDDSRDPDIQKFINKKKTDTLELESLPTKEEKYSKESEKNVPKKEQGYSWVVIGLAVVIIILIIIVVYYVLKYNEVSNGSDLIPNNIIKPSSILNNVFGTVTNPTTQPEKVLIQEPTKKDLDSVLNRLATIKEVDEVDDVDDVESNSSSDIDIVPHVPIKHVEVPKSILKTSTKTIPKIVEIIESQDDDNNAFLLSENFDEDELNPEIIEEIIDQANK